MLVSIISLAAAVFACLVAVPTVILAAQTLLALWPRKDGFANVPNTQPTTVVLIPAHNEGERICRTIRSVLKSGDRNVRVLVVADNCSDETAKYAAQSGAEVVKRFNDEKLGKAYALGFGIEHLRASPPEIVIVVDADAAMGGAGAGRLASIANHLQRPVQSLNVIDRRNRNEDAHSIVSTLGNRLHNVVRPLGYARLGLPCLLMGSGMAFPWAAIEEVGLENDDLGEDKQLGIDMALAGFPPIFCLETKVASHLTDEYAGYVGQRTRWEHGHIVSAVQQIPVLIATAFKTGRWYLIATAVDLAVPPIAVTAAGWMLAFGCSLVAFFLGGSSWPLITSFACAVSLATVLLTTWAGFARRRVPFASLLAVPMYVFRKLPIYLSLLARGPQRVWLRSDRSSTK